MVTYIFVGIFVLLIGNFAYYMFVQSKEIINNPYNKRQDLLADRVVRGKILGSKGETLAETRTSKGGKESRYYPYGSMFSHVVGRFSKSKTGIEQSENFNLLTSSTNAVLNAIKEMQGEKNIGDNIVTTLDVGLQKAAYDALGSRKGAVVAIEPDTGKILVMVSKPDYDPNQVSKNWDSLIEDSEHDSALLNRASQGLYAPGSTFKILTALEYIREKGGSDKYQYTCSGRDVFAGVTINCYGNKHHGQVDLKESFSESCNTSFANLAMSLDKGRWKSLCENFLFNKAMSLDFPYNRSSFVLDTGSKASDVPQTAIGQGQTLITPLHNAMITATVANGGMLMNPYVVDRIENKNKGVVKKYMPSRYGELMTSKESRLLTGYMEAVVKEGTGRKLEGLGFSVAGKTGSAEFNSQKESHSWFVGFAPVKNPKIVVSIIVEGAGTGNEAAVPIAKTILQTYMKK